MCVLVRVLGSRDERAGVALFPLSRAIWVAWSSVDLWARLLRHQASTEHIANMVVHLMNNDSTFYAPLRAILEELRPASQDMVAYLLTIMEQILRHKFQQQAKVCAATFAFGIGFPHSTRRTSRSSAAAVTDLSVPGILDIIEELLHEHPPTAVEVVVGFARLCRVSPDFVSQFSAESLALFKMHMYDLKRRSPTYLPAADVRDQPELSLDEANRMWMDLSKAAQPSSFPVGTPMDDQRIAMTVRLSSRDRIKLAEAVMDCALRAADLAPLPSDEELLQLETSRDDEAMRAGALDETDGAAEAVDDDMDDIDDAVIDDNDDIDETHPTDELDSNGSDRDSADAVN